MKLLTNDTLSASVRLAAFYLLAIGVVSANSAMAGVDKPHTITTSQPELLFEQNRGQFHKSVDFAARGDGYSVFLGPVPVVELSRFSDEPGPKRENPDGSIDNKRKLQSMARLRLSVLGASQDVQATPLQQRATVTHYLMGKKSDWRTNVPNFERVHYADILPQIDVEYYGRDGRLEYDFVVRPGGDPDAIKMQFEGADQVRINDNGALVIGLGDQEIVQRAPLSYQLNEDGQRQIVASGYTIDGNVVGFHLADWDSAKPLVIDPVLEYSRYFGGARFDRAREVDVDAAGNIYVIGESSSGGLGTAGAYLESAAVERFEQVSYPFCDDCTDVPLPSGQVRRVKIAGTSNLLITKFSPDGQTVLWSTYFNGSLGESLSLGIDAVGASAAGEVAFGLDNAGDGLPLVNQTQSWSASQSYVYVAKLNSAGSGLVFGTYLNLGDGFSWIRGLDVSAGGEVAATGLLDAGNSFPVVGGIPGQSCTLNELANEFTEGYVALFDATGTLTFSSCLGGEVRDGSVTEGLRGVAFGSSGDLYVLGYSAMTDFPVVNPIQATKNVAGAREMTISQIDPDTGALVFSTWFGPTTGDVAPSESGSTFLQLFPIGIKIDSGDNIVVSGHINGLSYPTVNAFQTNLGVPQDSAQFRVGRIDRGANDIFITKLHPVNGVVFSTYLGGSQADGGIPALAIDANDNIYTAVVTASDDYPVVNPIQASKAGDTSVALSQFTPAGALAFSTYLGGSSDQVFQLPGGLAVNAAGKIIVAGWTRSTDFPNTGSGTSNAGDYDMTLTIIDPAGDADTDGDGVPDAVDMFPENAGEWRDTDGDLIGDNSDTDDDGDGVPDATDAFPQDNSETADADGDGAGDNLDQFDADPFNYFDLDTDGIADFADTDADGDGLDAPDDRFDLDASETADNDGDGIGDNADDDDDQDGFTDAQDLDPLDAQSPVQTFEGYNPFNTNIYKSPWPDGYDSVVGADVPWTSATDQSRSGTTSFSSQIVDHGQTAAIQYNDTFADGIVQFWYKVDSQENFDLLTFSIDGGVALTASGDTGWQRFQTPITAGAHTLEWRYTKDGSISEGADAAWIDDLLVDSDGDGVPDDIDNCTVAANPLQRDTDGDGHGNFCDADFNNDCVVNSVDLGLFRVVFFSNDADGDLNGDGIVNPVDLGLFRSLFFAAPGPSAAGLCSVR